MWYKEGGGKYVVRSHIYWQVFREYIPDWKKSYSLILKTSGGLMKNAQPSFLTRSDLTWST